MAEMKRLYRSEKNKTFLGVLGGMGEYFDADPVLIRIIFIFLTIISGVIPGVLAYFICAAIMPLKK
jgi:phage shock protein C